MRKIIVVLLFSSISAAQCPTSTSLFFANGMQNTVDDAERSLKALKDRLPEGDGWQRDRGYLLFNPNSELFSQILDAYSQKMNEITVDFWRWVGDLGIAPNWFQEAVRKLVIAFELQQKRGVELGDFAAILMEELEEGRPFAIVGHSQGNFFANQVFDMLDLRNYPVGKQIRIVSVATPASGVRNDGPYFTLQSDGVIKWIPHALPANSVNSTPRPGLFDHEFIDHYLNGKPTGSEIISAVSGALKVLYKVNGESGDKTCWNWFKETRSSKLKDPNACLLSCVAEKIDMVTFTCHEECKKLCSCGSVK